MLGPSLCPCLKPSSMASSIRAEPSSWRPRPRAEMPAAPRARATPSSSPSCLNSARLSSAIAPDRLPNPAATLAHVPPHPPEQPRRSGDPRERFYFPVIQGPRYRGAQVAELDLEPRQPGFLLRSPKLRPGPFRQCQVVPCMGTAHGVGLTSLLQLLQRVLPDRFKHPVACPGGLRNDH